MLGPASAQGSAAAASSAPSMPAAADRSRCRPAVSFTDARLRGCGTFSMSVAIKRRRSRGALWECVGCRVGDGGGADLRQDAVVEAHRVAGKLVLAEQGGGEEE